MSERRSWTAEEDQILKMLREEKKIQKWTKIRQLMNSQYGIVERTDKQIRERYENHLKEGIVKAPWSPKEEATLIEMHLEHGNKWIFITQKIKQIGYQRSGNSIKNYFLSLMKRALRNFNRALSSMGKTKVFRPLPLAFIRRFLQRANQSFNNPQDNRKQVFQEIQQRLLEFSGKDSVTESKELRGSGFLEKTQILYYLIGSLQATRNRKKKKAKNQKNDYFLKSQIQGKVNPKNSDPKLAFQLKQDSEKKETMASNENGHEEASVPPDAHSLYEDNSFYFRQKKYKQTCQDQENMIFQEREWHEKNIAPFSFLDISEFFSN